MLSWNYNYGRLSAQINDGLYGKSVLLDDPDQLVEDEELAFVSALWYYMVPQ